MSAQDQEAPVPELTVSQKLRQAFPSEFIGKLPRVTCPECSDKRKTCEQHEKSKCAACGSYVSVRHIHLDYVGHADVTSRLLDADPDWAWEPQAREVDPAALAAALASGSPEVVRLVIGNSPPKFDLDEHGDPVGLWITLTAGGVSRPGYGSCPSGQGDAVKVLIGDALRNAAMRFGVAVDLWAKGDRADPSAENATASAGQANRRPQQHRESFNDATPAPPRGQQRRPANGTAVRPQQQDRPQVSATELDPDAQPYADEAHEANTVAAVQAIHVRAREAHKLAALVTNPATGGNGGLGAYLNWRKSALEKADKAYQGVVEAGKALGLEGGELAKEFARLAGCSVEAATTDQLDQTAAKLRSLAPAAGGS